MNGIIASAATEILFFLQKIHFLIQQSEEQRFFLNFDFELYGNQKGKLFVCIL